MGLGRFGSDLELMGELERGAKKVFSITCTPKCAISHLRVQMHA